MSCWRVGTRGTRMPLSSATCRVHAPAASTTIGPSIVPFAVVTPVTLPALMFTASTSVFGSKSAPPAAAALAKPTATCDGSKYLSSPTLIAASTRFGFKKGLSRPACSGEMSSTSSPMRRPRLKSASMTSASWGRRAIFMLPMHPIERVTGFFCERFNLAARILDKADHQVTLAGAADHARSTG